MSLRAGGREVLFEIVRIGAILRVSAIDAAANVEVVVQGPAGGGPEPLKALALRKLERRLAGAPAP